MHIACITVSGFKTFRMTDQNSGVESGERFTGYGYGGLQAFVASFQLAEIVDNLTW